MKHFSISNLKFQGASKIEVLSMSPVENRGSLRAFVTIQLGDLIINDCRVIQESGKRPWLSMPVLSYTTQYGTVQYRTLVQIANENLKKEISQVVLEHWEKYNWRAENEASHPR